ncbi:hypothetical protein K474DRAFT_1677215 [Panus rudis PR-1116 ss-1]|nr:hypothetical protein K474DRAFT_1677215 [Panus rudis PR-1116 ss-1]
MRLPFFLVTLVLASASYSTASVIHYQRGPTELDTLQARDKVALRDAIAVNLHQAASLVARRLLEEFETHTVRDHLSKRGPSNPPPPLSIPPSPYQSQPQPQPLKSTPVAPVLSPEQAQAELSKPNPRIMVTPPTPGTENAPVFNVPGASRSRGRSRTRTKTGLGDSRRSRSRTSGRGTR